MSNQFRTHLNVEGLGDRITPSAFRGLNVAAAHFYPTDTTLTASPVFALNYGTVDAGWNGHALAGLNVAAELYPTDPSSPIFVGLIGGGSVDTPPL